jgi:hypothetical protein
MEALGVGEGEGSATQNFRHGAEAQRANPFQQVYFFVSQM